MKRQGISAIEKGDVVLFYTGWLKLIGKDNKRFGSAAPGLGREGAKYLASLEVAMVGSDTWAFEVVPFEKDAGVFESIRLSFRSTAYTYSRISILKRW
jgi:kynurenine formamidase